MKKGIKIKLAYAIVTDGSKFVAVAPHLNIVGFGNTENEAEADLDKAVKSFLAFHQQHKNIDAKLISLGWSKVDHERVPPRNFRLNLPTEMAGSSNIKSRTTSKDYAMAC